MNILFLTISYPEEDTKGDIYGDLMDYFIEKGHSVYVVSSRERRKQKNTEYKNENGVNILRVKTGNIVKVNMFEKGLSTLSIQWLYIRAIKKYLSNIKFDLIIYSTPPITFANVIKYVKNRDSASSYLLLKDIFPQNAVDLNIIKIDGIFYKFFKNKEKQLYMLSDYIGCMSKRNVEYLLMNNNYLDKDRVDISPNSIQPRVRVDRNNRAFPMRTKYQIPIDKSVFVYGGNFGKPQGVDFLIEVLKQNQTQEDCFFLLIGSGTEFSKLRDFYTTYKPKNVLLLSFLPKSEYDQLIKECDVGMIFLDRRFTIPNIPSRLLAYMEFSMPVLAATDAQTDLGEIIREGEFGLWCESGNIEQFNRYLKSLSNNKELIETMGENARLYLEKHYTVDHTYNSIMKHFETGVGAGV